MTIAAVILAAGAGSRFAGDRHKLEAELDGVAVLRRAVGAALACTGDDGPLFDEVIVVSGAFDPAGLLDGLEVTLVHNPLWAGGQSSSLRAAIGAAEGHGHRTVVVGLGDQPLVGPDAWRAVATTAGPIVTATFDGRRRPPVKLEASVWDLLPVTGDHGARYLMEGRPELVTEVACEGNPADIDTQEDLSRWN